MKRDTLYVPECDTTDTSWKRGALNVRSSSSPLADFNLLTASARQRLTRKYTHTYIQSLVQQRRVFLFWEALKGRGLSFSLSLSSLPPSLSANTDTHTHTHILGLLLSSWVLHDCSTALLLSQAPRKPTRWWFVQREEKIRTEKKESYEETLVVLLLPSSNDVYKRGALYATGCCGRRFFFC
jgi:hypothetical protein